MSETTLLYLGACCFLLALIGMVLTVREFRKMSPPKDSTAARRPRSIDSPAPQRS